MRQRGFSRGAWYGERTSYPTRCRDILERIATTRYICPYEVRLLVDRIARKWGVRAGSIEQHAFSNTYADRYLKDGIGDYKEGCSVEGCEYSRYSKFEKKYRGIETRCMLCLKERVDHRSDCSIQVYLEKQHAEQQVEYCGVDGNGSERCEEILDTIIPFKQRTWNKVRYRDLSFEYKGIFILSKFLLQKAESLLRYRRARAKTRKQNN